MTAERKPEILADIDSRVIEEPIPEKGMFIRVLVTTPEDFQSHFSWMESKSNFPLKVVEWNNLIVILEDHPNMEIFDEPKESESKEQGSEAVYFAQSRFKAPGILIQGLEPDKITTDHVHKEHSERFKKAFGDCEIHLENSEAAQIVNLVSELEIPPMTYHQLRGAGQGSIVLIVTSGSDDCLAKADHDYRPGNRFTS